MSRTLKVIIATALFVVGAVGAWLFLTGQGLDRAEKWVSIVVGVTSLVLGAAGLVLGWLTWRNERRVVRGHRVVADGIAAVAVGEDNQADVITNVSGVMPSAGPGTRAGDGVIAGGAGSVAVGGSSTAPIRTTVKGLGNKSTGP